MTFVPTSDIDLFADDTLRNPYPAYQVLRDLGPVVRLEPSGMYAIPRYDALREAAANWEVFSSARGVAITDDMNDAIGGTMLCSDPPEHDAMRRVLERPLRPDTLRDVTPLIKAEAAKIVESLVAKKTFDAATELAPHLPLTVVSKLVGLGDFGRERMLEWSTAGFDALGPKNQRFADASPKIAEWVEWSLTQAKPGVIDPGGWAAGLYEAGERGELPVEKCPVMVMDYTGPALDTTISATTSAISLFAQFPDQWSIVRENPGLIPHAINEVVRLESPIRLFTRFVTRDHDIEGYTIPAGARIIMLFGSANRDERHYERPDVFDVRRKPSDHVGFGHGKHACAGMNLARLEIRCLLEELVKHVERFTILESEPAVNNGLRGLTSLRVSVEV